MTVVEDSPKALWLFMPAGCIRKVPHGTRLDPNYPAGRKDRIVADLHRGTWEHEDHAWEGTTLVVVRPGDWYAMWCSWRPDGSHWGYYINLQMPYRRTDIGIETMDLMLDVTIKPDLTWSWKDEDELADIVALGMYSDQLVKHIRAEAQRAIDDVEARRWPFDGTFATMVPPQPWPMPVLPPDWHIPR
jgi:protein associated with RNAse G/E